MSGELTCSRRPVQQDDPVTCDDRGVDSPTREQQQGLSIAHERGLQARLQDQRLPHLLQLRGGQHPVRGHLPIGPHLFIVNILVSGTPLVELEHVDRGCPRGRWVLRGVGAPGDEGGTLLWDGHRDELEVLIKQRILKFTRNKM